MGKRRTKAKTAVFEALEKLGGEASTRSIASAAHLDTNHAADILAHLSNVVCVGGKGVDGQWRLRLSEDSLEGATKFLSGVSP